MTSLARGQSDSYSNAFATSHDGFNGTSNAHSASSNNGTDYSGAVSGNLNLNFPPGLGSTQNGGSQPSLLGRPARGGGFGSADDSGSAWRVQQPPPHEQKMPTPQQGQHGGGGGAGGAVGGPRGAPRGAIGGPAPPRQPHMDRTNLYGGSHGGVNGTSGGGAGSGRTDGGGGFPSLYPTSSKRPRSRYDFYGQQS